MFARSTTVTGSADALDAGIALVRDEIMPVVTRMEGCRGLSLLVDRETGGAIVTTSWDSAEAMQASESTVGPMRDRAEQRFGGRADVREWEIAVLHRSRPVPEEACARVTWLRVDPRRLPELLEVYRAATVRQIEDLPGFCSTSFLVDRRSGLGAVSTTYATRQVMVANREEASDLRADVSQRLAAEILDVAEFEVVLAHLRVPETV